MAMEHSNGSLKSSERFTDIDPCDYIKSPFEIAMYRVKAALYDLGVGMIGVRGEVNPEYFGDFHPLRSVKFLLRKGEQNGLVQVTLSYDEEWRTDEAFEVPISTVVSQIKVVLGYH